MERLKSLQEYRDLMEEVKSVCDIPFSNVFFWPADLEKYIKSERLYYERNNAGIAFFSDEGSYYKLSICVDKHKPFTIESREKRLLVRSIYKEKSEDWETVEHTLEANGFFKAGSVLQMKINVRELLEKNVKLEKYISIMNKKGYDCVTADMEMLMEMRKLIDKSITIKDYQIDYRTPEETMEDLSEGACLCIVNEQGKVCAGSYAHINNNIAEGAAIVVDEQYKMNGFAPVLLYERCRRLAERGVKYLRGWVLTDNDASLKYHKSMGYQFTGIYADEWILEKVTKS